MVRRWLSKQNWAIFVFFSSWHQRPPKQGFLCDRLWRMTSSILTCTSHRMDGNMITILRITINLHSLQMRSSFNQLGPFEFFIIISWGLWTLESSTAISNLSSRDERLEEYISTLVVVKLSIMFTLRVCTCYCFWLRASISFANAYELPATVSSKHELFCSLISTNTVG